MPGPASNPAGDALRNPLVLGVLASVSGGGGIGFPDVPRDARGLGILGGRGMGRIWREPAQGSSALPMPHETSIWYVSFKRQHTISMMVAAKTSYPAGAVSHPVPWISHAAISGVVPPNMAAPAL